MYIDCNFLFQIISIKRLTDKVKSFDSDYMSQLRYEPQANERNNAGIPREWFEEFYQVMNQCHLRGSVRPMNLGLPDCDTSQVRSISTLPIL